MTLGRSIVSVHGLEPAAARAVESMNNQGRPSACVVSAAAVDDQGVLRAHVVGMSEAAGADVAHINAGSITRRIVERLHELGLTVHANDAGSEADMVLGRDSGVDSLSANGVATAVAVRDDQAPLA